MDALKLIAQSSMKADMPKIEVGDYVRVNVKIREGDKERIQAFEGTVIAMKHGGISETFTVRRVAHGVGIEKSFPDPFAQGRFGQCSASRRRTARKAVLPAQPRWQSRQSQRENRIIGLSEEEGGGSVSFFCFSLHFMKEKARRLPCAAGHELDPPPAVNVCRKGRSAFYGIGAEKNHQR